MNHGYDDDEEEGHYPNPRAQMGPGGLLAQLMGGGMGGFNRFLGHAPPSAYDEYYKAYSVAVMGGKEREELLYGGKIIMPPSALAKLSQLDIESPWTFQLRHPRNPTQKRTHAGVLEFIADEGIVHLPAWMMKTLDLNEGDPVRLTGAVLPKGKMVKIQAQSTDFLQVSDAKAVLESALRFYSTLTEGDIIEITYNSLTFEFLIMSTTPAGPGISVIDTDLEVDFETPVGYVEPPRPEPKAVPTMAEKLKIDLGSTSSSRAESRASGGSGGGSVAGGSLESFTGVGTSLSGKRVKGKGLAKKIEEVDTGGKLLRDGTPRIITPDALGDIDRKVPAALHLPAGKFFFGFKYIPFDEAKATKPSTASGSAAASTSTTNPASSSTGPQAFGGQGESLRRKPGSSSNTAGPSSIAGNGSLAREEVTVKEEGADPWAKLGGGNSLKGKNVVGKRKAEATEEEGSQRNKNGASTGSGGDTAATGSGGVGGGGGGGGGGREVIDATMLDDEDDFMFEDYGDDDDGIDVD